MTFRCSEASVARGEDLAGTASTVRAFLLVEDDGPWGVSALRDARIPAAVSEHLRNAPVRALLVRRHDKTHRDAGVRVFAAYADPAAPWLEATTLDSTDQLTQLDLSRLAQGRSLGWERSEEPLFAVCTHGRHDACCAERGRPVAAALTASHPAYTWEVSHIGGDRFAGNLLVLPYGLYYGRVTPEAAPGLAEAHLAGRLDLPRLRGRTSYPFAVQYAELALRRGLGESRIDAVTLVGVDGLEATFEHAGRRYAVTVHREAADPVQTTCAGARLQTVPVFETASIVPPATGVTGI